MKDWKLIVKANGFDISDQEVDRFKPTLDDLEAAFRPLIQRIPLELEPAVIFRRLPEESQ
jgi:hypothetical protein